MAALSDPLKLTYNESLITFIEPLNDVEYAIVGACGIVFLFTLYNGMKLRAATNALNNAPKSVKVSVAIYTYISALGAVPLVLAMLQVGAPSYAAHVVSQSVYCMGLGVRVLWLFQNDRDDVLYADLDPSKPAKLKHY
jgi:hypothetical protein